MSHTQTEIDKLKEESTNQIKLLIDVGSRLAAAISLLEGGGKAAKKAAPSDKMFDQMIIDYKASLERLRSYLSQNEKESK